MTGAAPSGRRRLSLIVGCLGGIAILYGVVVEWADFFRVLPLGRYEFLPVILTAVLVCAWTSRALVWLSEPGLRGHGRTVARQDSMLDRLPDSLLGIATVCGLFGFGCFVSFLAGAIGAKPATATQVARAVVGFGLIFLCLATPITLNYWFAGRPLAPDALAPPSRPVRVLGAATYPLRRNPKTYRDRYVELRADARGVSLRAGNYWLPPDFHDELLPERLRERGDWYTSWPDVVMCGPGDRMLAVHTRDGDGIHFWVPRASQFDALEPLLRANSLITEDHTTGIRNRSRPSHQQIRRPGGERPRRAGADGLVSRGSVIVNWTGDGYGKEPAAGLRVALALLSGLRECCAAERMTR